MTLTLPASLYAVMLITTNEHYILILTFLKNTPTVNVSHISDHMWRTLNQLQQHNISMAAPIPNFITIRLKRISVSPVELLQLMTTAVLSAPCTSDTVNSTTEVSVDTQTHQYIKGIIHTLCLAT